MTMPRPSTAHEDHSTPIIKAIEHWRRQIECRKPDADAHNQLRNAAIDLRRMLDIDRTVYPESHAVTRQAAVDALHEMATIGDLEPDDAQTIFAQAFNPASAPESEEPAPQYNQDKWRIMAREAQHGLTRHVTNTLKPHTESDPAAILIQYLAAVGNVIGLGPFYQVEGDFHYSKLFLCLIGATSKGRKGTSLNRVRQILKLVDENWNQYRVQSGLASGEGLIHHVRDPLFKLQDGAMKEVDRGISDKRLLIEAEEFASVIAVMSKPGNTLSPV